MVKGDRRPGETREDWLWPIYPNPIACDGDDDGEDVDEDDDAYDDDDDIYIMMKCLYVCLSRFCLFFHLWPPFSLVIDCTQGQRAKEGGTT